MQQIILKLLFVQVLLLFVTIAFVPDITSAQVIDIPCDGPDCDFCHFVTLANSVIAWLIGVLAVVFGVMIFVAGFGLVTSGGNQSKLEEAKKSLTNALIGLIVVLAAWLIVDTLLKATLSEGQTATGPWNQVKCEGSQLVADSFVDGNPRTQICPRTFASGLQPPSTCSSCAPSSVDGQSSQNICQCRSPLPAGQELGAGCVVEAPPASNPTASTSAECSDDAALLAKYGGSPIGLVDPQLTPMINCYLADSAVNNLVDKNQIYTVDRSHPRCSLTRGNPVCGPCSHSNGSKHYGTGTGARAVDFNSTGSEQALYNALNAKKSQCGGVLLFEGDHTHIGI